MEASGKRDVEVPISHQNPDRRGKWTRVCLCASVTVGDGGVKCAPSFPFFGAEEGVSFVCVWM